MWITVFGCPNLFCASTVRACQFPAAAPAANSTAPAVTFSTQRFITEFILSSSPLLPQGMTPNFESRSVVTPLQFDAPTTPTLRSNRPLFWLNESSRHRATPISAPAHRPARHADDLDRIHFGRRHHCRRIYRRRPESRTGKAHRHSTSVSFSRQLCRWSLLVRLRLSLSRSFGRHSRLEASDLTRASCRLPLHPVLQFVLVLQMAQRNRAIRQLSPPLSDHEAAASRYSNS